MSNSGNVTKMIAKDMRAFKYGHTIMNDDR